MKTHDLSLALLGCVFLFIGCSSLDDRNNYYKSTNEDRPLVDEKYKLSADRKKLEELRNEIPEDRKTQNDELAFVLQLMSEHKKSPSEVRSKFDDALRKKREKFSKDMTKERENFNKVERKNREEFLKNMDSERKDFMRVKHPKEERDDFFARQDARRKEYFEDQREKRNDFESDMTERRKNFEDYAREKTSEFNQEWRSYQKRYDEIKKEKEAEKTAEKMKMSTGSLADKKPQDASNYRLVPNDFPGESNEVKSFLQELEEAHSYPGTKLESGQ